MEKNRRKQLFPSRLGQQIINSHNVDNDHGYFECGTHKIHLLFMYNKI